MLVQVRTRQAQPQPCSLRGLGCSSCANAARCGARPSGVSGLGFTLPELPDLSSLLPVGIGAGAVTVIVGAIALYLVFRRESDVRRKKRLATRQENERHQAEISRIRAMKRRPLFA